MLPPRILRSVITKISSLTTVIALNLSLDCSEVNKSTNEEIFTGQVLVKCKNNIFVGSWHQTGNEGFGVAQSESGVKLDFTFSNNRNDAVASLKSELTGISQKENKI